MESAAKAKLLQSKDYRAFLRSDASDKANGRGYKAQLAQSAGCQPAYLSQVLRDRTHLTPEQAERLGRFWGLSEIESEYFFNLVLLGRAGTPALREQLEKKLVQLRARWKKKENTYEQKSLEESDRAFIYYSKWIYSAVHVLLTVPQLQSAAALASHLKMEVAEIEEALRDLLRIGLVQKSGSSWQTTQAMIHSPESSHSAELHHRNWRIQALEHGAKKKRNAVHYTSVHTLNAADFLKVRDILGEAIKDARKTIAPSKEEMGACLIIDYFSLNER